MTLTLREKLNGYRLFQSFVSPYTDRTLKPFIFRDNAMCPPWMKLIEEIVHFKQETLKKTPSEKMRLVVLHDHNYASNTERMQPNENKREFEQNDASHVEKEKSLEEIKRDPSDYEDSMQMEEKNKEEKRKEDKAQCEREGNVFKNKEDKIRTKDKLSLERTIDFCYVREEHIRPINTLVEEHFWPNINMAECLLYPEFTVVALYKKLVVGLGAMVPHPSKPNETYITFLATRRHWQQAGIGSFMLYHLIATCQSAHITLHCSVSRMDALNLYFKFGFKVQCVVLNFYKPYLCSHPDVDMSPHAYCLKYSRNIN